MARSIMNGVTKEVLQGLRITWPDKDPILGEAFSKSTSFTIDKNSHSVDFPPPLYPSRQIAIAWETRYDENDDYDYEVETEWRDRTDEEWEEALAEYKKSPPLFVKNGPDIIFGTFTTDSGVEVHGTYDGEKWHWDRWSYSEKRRAR